MDHPVILEAWLEQRRKNFPSSGNVKLKQLREQAKIDHGIIAREKSYTFKDSKWGVKRHKPCVPETDKTKSPDKVLPNDPLSFILNPGEKKHVPESASLLGMGAYNSSSESESEAAGVQVPKPSESKTNEPNVGQALRKFKRYAKMRAADGKKKREKVKWNGVMKSGRRRYQPTLLQKLLSRDIIREHNTVLQCVRFVVNNNFFDKTPPEPIQSDVLPQCNETDNTNHETEQHQSESKLITVQSTP